MIEELIRSLVRSKGLQTEPEGPKITDRVQAGVMPGEDPIFADVTVTYDAEIAEVVTSIRVTPPVFTLDQSDKVLAVMQHAIKRGFELSSDFRGIFKVPPKPEKDSPTDNPDASGAV